MEPVATVNLVTADSLPSTSRSHVSVSELYALPQATSKPRTCRSGQSSTILTDSPYKRFLQSKSPVAKVRKRLAVSNRQRGSKNQAETKTVTSKPKPKPKPKLKPKSKRGAKTTVESDDDDDDDDEEWPCLVCCEPFKNSRKGEKWICCVSCERWAHVLCTGLDSKAKTYVCDNCDSDDSFDD